MVHVIGRGLRGGCASPPTRPRNGHGLTKGELAEKARVVLKSCSLVPRPHPLRGKKGLVSSARSLGYAHYQLLHKGGTLLCNDTLHTHVACVGMGTSTDSADLQSDWHAEIPPRVVKLLA